MEYRTFQTDKVIIVCMMMRIVSVVTSQGAGCWGHSDRPYLFQLNAAFFYKSHEVWVFYDRVV